MRRNVVFFSSGGPGNFQTVVDFCMEHDGVSLIHLITDRPGIPAIEVAVRHGIPYSVIPVEGRLHAEERADRDRRVRQIEPIRANLAGLIARFGQLDLIVLAYRKILIGPIVDEYRAIMINVHPSDLSIYDIASRQRRYIGIGGLRQAIRDGCSDTRTSIHRVSHGVDDGELLCLGPPVLFTGNPESEHDIAAHEQKQKVLSDRPALRRTLTRWVTGNVPQLEIMSPGEEVSVQ